MRIAFLLARFPAVSETFILQQVQGALARGHEVDIFAINPKRGEPKHGMYVEWRMEECVHWRPGFQFQTAREAVEAAVTIGLWALRRPVLFLRCVRQFLSEGVGNPLALFGAAVSVADAGSKSYDAIHAHFADLGLLAVRLRKLGVLVGPLLTSFHGVDVTQRRSPKKQASFQQLFTEGDGFTHPSDFLGGRASAIGCPPERQRKLYCGVDPGKFRFKARATDGTTPVRIVSIARLVEKKGLEYGISAVAEVIGHGKNVEYAIIGDGPRQAQLEEQIRKLGVESRIRLLGAQDGNSVRRLLDEAHIFLLPSVTAENGDMEGLPVSLLEAQMCGLPVVSTLHSGIPEGVDDGESAFLVKERDASALAERIEYLVDHPELWPAMGRAGRAHVEERFNIEKLNDDLIELYENLGSGMKESPIPSRV